MRYAFSRKAWPGNGSADPGLEIHAAGDGQTKTERAELTEDEMRKRLETLRIEHRDLDVAIDALSGAMAGTQAGPGTSTAPADQLQVARLKKRKLKLRDQIAMLEDYLIPDIIA